MKGCVKLLAHTAGKYGFGDFNIQSHWCLTVFCRIDTTPHQIKFKLKLAFMK